MPEQIVALPLIKPGVAGTLFTVNAKVCKVEDPQELLAVTVMLPPVVPAVALMLIDEEVPDQPPGKVQV